MAVESSCGKKTGIQGSQDNFQDLRRCLKKRYKKGPKKFQKGPKKASKKALKIFLKTLQKSPKQASKRP